MGIKLVKAILEILPVIPFRQLVKYVIIAELSM